MFRSPPVMIFFIGLRDTFLQYLPAKFSYELTNFLQQICQVWIPRRLETIDGLHQDTEQRFTSFIKFHISSQLAKIPLLDDSWVHARLQHSCLRLTLSSQRFRSFSFLTKASDDAVALAGNLTRLRRTHLDRTIYLRL